MMKTSPFYLLYGRHPHLFSDDNAALPTEAEVSPDEERLKLLESARKEAAIATYERALKDKDTRDDLIKLHKLDTGEWVLVRNENPLKFEAKWFGPYQIVEKKLLGTYRLQDPNGRELTALIHGNRLIKANIRTADELRDLWASPKAKDKLWKRNRHVELIPSYPENTNALEWHLYDDDHDDGGNPTALDDALEFQDNTSSSARIPPIVRKYSKRKRELEVYDEIIVEQPLKQRSR
jgi:hypothetical protein